MRRARPNDARCDEVVKGREMEVIANLPCDANDHVLRVTADLEDGLVYFDIFVGAFYAGQVSLLERLRTRLAIIFNVLRGREFLFEEVVVRLEDTRDLNKLPWVTVDLP